MNVKHAFLFFLVLAFGFSTMPSLAQQDHSSHGNQQQDAEQDNSGGMMRRGEGEEGGGMRRMRRGMERMQERMTGNGAATVGQSAFAVIRDVTRSLQADPDTDWSQINLEALRRHLVDMDRITLYSEVETSELEGGSRYLITAEDERTVEAIRRMVPAHAQQIERELGWDTATDTVRDGIELTVVSNDPAQTAMIRGLGFIGFMVQGEHHADHHLMLAGGNPEASGGMGMMDRGGMNRGGDDDEDASDQSGNHNH